MIELMVSLVILAVVIAGLARPLLGAFSTASQVRSGQGAQASVLRATEQLQGDVLSARSPDRNTDKQRGIESLTRALLVDAKGNSISDDPGDNGKRLDVYDILTATSTRLQMVVEEDANNKGSECVQWDAANTALTGRVSLRRQQFRNRSCIGGTTADDWLIPDQAFLGSFLGETRAAVPPVFGYQLVCNPSASFCKGMYGSAGPGCQGWSATSAPTFARNLVMAITIDLRSVEQQAGHTGASRAKTVIAIPAREGTDYRRALGCG